jgi:hypothetical protein
MCRKCGPRAAHRLRPRPAASSPCMAGEASRRPRSADVRPTPPSSPGSRGSTACGGETTICWRESNAFWRGAEPSRLRSNAMRTQRASTPPGQARSGAASAEAPPARSSPRPTRGSGQPLSGKADHRPAHGASSGARAGHVGELRQAHGLTPPAGTSWLAPRARATRSASRASPAGRLPRRSRRREARPCCRRRRG